MKVTLSPETEQRIAGKVALGEIENADALVDEAVNFYLDCDEQETDEEELLGAQAAIQEALEQGARGEGRPAEEVFSHLRDKYGLSR